MTQGPAAFIADPERANRSLRLLAGTGAQRMLFGHGPELDNPASALTELIRPTSEPGRPEDVRRSPAATGH